MLISKTCRRFEAQCMMIYICVICTSKQPPLLFLTADQRQLLEAILSPSLNMTELRTRQLLLCASCMNQVESLQMFQHTALEGAKKLLELYKLIGQNNGSSAQVSIKMEPSDVPITNPLTLTEELNIKFEPECDEAVGTPEYHVPVLDPTAENVQTYPTKPEFAAVPMPILNVPQPPTVARPPKPIFRVKADVQKGMVTHSNHPRIMPKPCLVRSKPANQSGLVPSSSSLNGPLQSWEVPPLPRPKQKPVVCKVCNKTLSNNANLKLHHMRAHGTGPVKCDLCDFVSKNEPAMRQHRNSHKAKAKGPEAVENLRSEWFCVECHMQFPNTTAYRQHMMTLKHTTRDKWSFECETCHRKFPDKRRLELHMDSVHLNRKPNKCDKCEKSYTTPYGLRFHVSTVHDKVPLPKKYTCHFCGDSFASKPVLLDHINTHTGARPHVCRICGDTFGHKSALYLHGRLKHKIPYKKKIEGPKKTKKSNKNKKSNNTKEDDSK